MMREKIKHPIFIISIFAIIGILLRLYYFPFEIPFSYDMLDYFAYALTESSIGRFPDNVALANNGWPTIVSIFVSLSNSNNLMDLTYLQRIIGISFSILTVIPIYFLARKFFTQNIALIAPGLFILEPNILMNSILGGTMPIFIFLGTSIILLFLSDRIKIITVAFALIAILSFMRYEGLLLIFPLSIMFFIRFRNKRSEIKKYFFMILVFLLVISPIAFLRIDAYGYDGFVSNFIDSGKYVTNVLGGEIPSDDEEWIITGENNIPDFLKFGGINLLKFLGITMIPIFLSFVLISIIYLIKKRNQLEINAKILSVVFYSLIFLIPAFYAYGRHIEELRYLLILFPIFSLFSLFSIKIIFQKIRNYNAISVLIVGGVIILSVGFIEYDKDDYVFERESFYIAKKVVEAEYGYNIFSPASKFIKSAEIYNHWPTTIEFGIDGHVARQTIGISDANFESLDLFLIKSEEKGLTHLVIDDRDRPNFLKDIFLHEEEFPYLKKIYDSNDEGLEYKVKIFRINYNSFHEYIEQ